MISFISVSLGDFRRMCCGLYSYMLCHEYVHNMFVPWFISLLMVMLQVLV